MSGLTFTSKVDVNFQAIQSKYDGALKHAQAPLDAMIMQDSNFFVPLKTGTLQKSAILNTKIGSGLVVWATPYARRLYYEYIKPESQINPYACAKWFEAAKALYSEKWVRLVNEHIKRVGHS